MKVGESLQRLLRLVLVWEGCPYCGKGKIQIPQNHRTHSTYKLRHEAGAAHDAKECFARQALGLGQDCIIQLQSSQVCNSILCLNENRRICGTGSSLAPPRTLGLRLCVWVKVSARGETRYPNGVRWVQVV